MSQNWSWYSDEDKDSIVVKAVQAVAVYSNPDGEVVIRQQDAMGGDDSVIIIPKLYVPALIDAIKRELAEGS